MHRRSAFHLDCTPAIRECGFECPKCIREIESTLTGMQGVSKAYIEKEGEEQRLVDEHDPAAVTVKQLLDVLEGLPSYYEGFFIPAHIAS